MTRVVSSGFELNSVAAGMEVTSATGSPSISSSTVRSGGFSLSIPSLTSGTARGIRYQFIAAANNGPFFCRAYLRITTLPAVENAILQLNDTNDFSAPMVYVTLDSGGLLALFDEDGQIGSDSSALSTGTWYRIEVEFNNTGGAGAGIVKARIDGVEFAASTTRSISAGVQSYSVGGNLNSEANGTGAWFFDDLALNDSSGSFQTSYPGAGEIIFLRPSAAGDNSAWTRGGADSGANWSQVEEVTPNDATDYNGANTAETIDDYNLEATPGSMDSGDTINVVAVGVRWRLDDATGSDPSFVLRIMEDTGGTVQESSAISINNTSWRTNSNSLGAPIYNLTLYDLPGASTTAWTKAKLDTAQIGVRLTVTDTHNINVSAIWLMVEHTPGASAEDKSASDSGTESESGTVEAAVPATDSGSLSESGSTAADLSGADTGALSETAALATETTGAETGGFTEAASLAADVAGEETAVFSETGTIDATVAASDDGLFTESGVVGTPVAGEESGAFEDVGSLAVAVSGAETVVFSETAAIVVMVTGSETGAFVDAASLDTGEVVYVLAQGVIVPATSAGAVIVPASIGE